MPWGHHPGAFGRWLNPGGYRVSDLLMRPIAEMIPANARALGLPPRRRAEDCFSPVAQLAQCVRGLDFPRAALPASFHYLGPFRERGAVRVDLPERDGRPLAYVSLGTLQGSRAALFGSIAEACASQGLQPLIAHGGRLDPADAARLPGKPIVRAWVPQPAVLGEAAVAVTHAGFNTVLDALGARVPIVAIPLAFEQPATAARLARSGAAEVVWRGHSSRRISRAIGRVLASPSYRERARLLGAEVRASGGVERAADLVEAAL